MIEGQETKRTPRAFVDGKVQERESAEVDIGIVAVVAIPHIPK